MPKGTSENELKEGVQERFNELPKVLQDAITSTDVEKHLRELADTNKLHIDQWELLENEVLLTLMGFDEPENFTENLKSNVGLADEVARNLAADISRVVFEPIRAQLEENLHDSEVEQGTTREGIGDSRTLQEASAVKAIPALPVAATPPPAPPTSSAVRAPISESYAAKQPSHERKVIEGDPYREQFT